jgi:hypothetical protein
LKQSTAKLCHQLTENPDVEGNQKEIKKHKKELVDIACKVEEELQELKFESFASDIDRQLKEQSRYQELQAKEKLLNLKIKEITELEKQKRDENTKTANEQAMEIAEKKKIVNETEVDSKLHLQYKERFIEGQQSCRDREYRKTESIMEKQIENLKAQLRTEQLVTETIRNHLQKKQAELQQMTQARQKLTEQEGAVIDEEKKKIQEQREDATNEFERVKAFIADDDEYRANLAKLEAEKDAAEEEKVKEKMSMDEAARFIQRKWNWFQTVGKFLAKKKKGRKGGKKKKK